jgi:hypothetical protein
MHVFRDGSCLAGWIVYSTLVDAAVASRSTAANIITILRHLIACGFPETRSVFYPPLNRHDTASADSYHEYFLKYDIKVRTEYSLQRSVCLGVG